VDAASRTAYFAGIDLAINAITLLIQVLLTRGLLQRFGVAPVLMIPSVVVLLGFSVLTASPLPMLVAVVQVITRAGEFSLMKPARETLDLAQLRYLVSVSWWQVGCALVPGE
jgi:AAA family ATP:ADP antiporter